jgi:uncharacterized protein YqgC (DUF456 family)
MGIPLALVVMQAHLCMVPGLPGTSLILTKMLIYNGFFHKTCQPVKVTPFG